MPITAYGKIQEAKFSEGGTYLLPGVYRIEVIACKHIKTRQGREAFVVELSILESNNPERPPGSTCSWMVMLDQEPALGNIKNFISAAYPCEDSQVSEQAVLLIVGEKNPLKGHRARASAVNIKTKNRGTDFTKVKWFEDSVGAGTVAADQSSAA